MVIFQGAASPYCEMNKSNMARADNPGAGRFLIRKGCQLAFSKGIIPANPAEVNHALRESGLFSLHALEIGQNEFRQITAVTAFQHAEHRRAERTQRLSEPVKILRLQRAAAERIAHIGIKPGGCGDQIRFEFVQILQRPGEGGTVAFAR